MEENLYKEYLPEDYQSEDVITYQWKQNREEYLQGKFNFYHSITKHSISKGSMLIYLLLILTIGVISDLLANVVQALIDMFI